MTAAPRLPKGTPKGDLIRFGGQTFTLVEWEQFKREWPEVTAEEWAEWRRAQGRPAKESKESKEE